MTPLCLLASGLLLAQVISASIVQFSNPVYIISNAETPLSGADLTPVGIQRAKNCITSIFNTSAPFNIGLIIACKPNKAGDCLPALDTVTPLSVATGLSINSKCGLNSNDNCVSDIINAFVKKSNASILISWDQASIGNVIGDFDVDGAPSWPAGHYDPIWQLEFETKSFVAQTLQNCPGIDGDTPPSS